MTDATSAARSEGLTFDPAERLRSALDEANIPTLLMVLVHLTGDRRWLDERYRPRRARPLDDNDTGGLSPEVQEEVRAASLDAALAYLAGGLTPSDLSHDDIARMLEISIVESIPREYGPLLAEELGLSSRDVEVPPLPPGRSLQVVVIGSGISGLCAAIKLQNAGIDYTVIEKDPDIGGTWLENTYPGCGVDTPSHLYSFSFAPNTQWSRYFARRKQVHEYLSELADAAGVLSNFRFGTEVVGAEYEESTATWLVDIACSDGARERLTCDILISAVGQVNRPLVPAIPGLDQFPGPVMHTAQWRDDVELDGKRVAVVGTGASAMQIVPTIAETTEQVLIFQRSRQWAVPHPNVQREVSDDVKYLLEAMPFYGAWYRLRAFWNFGDRLHSALQIDPDWPNQELSVNAANEKHRVFLTEYAKSELGDRHDLIDACIPDYPPYGKRPLVDYGWFRSVRRDDVELVSEGVTEVRGNRLVTESGGEFEADVIVMATGFKVRQFLWPMEIRGRSGRLLSSVWGAEDARAYLGITVPGFPNFFILNGPNTFAGHGGSAIIATEFQMRYVMDMLAKMIDRDLSSVEVREDVFWDYNHELDEALSRMIWAHPNVTNYFQNAAGRIVVSSPWTYIDYWRRTQTANLDDYHVEPGAEALNVRPGYAQFLG